MNEKLMFSSDKMYWETPKKFFDELNKQFEFTLDPCSNQKNSKCKKFYNEKENGLIQDWTGEVVFCNPPYGTEIKKWVKKCHDENLYNSVTCVMLIPARTDTIWFHEYIYNNCHCDITFLKGRLKFEIDGEPIRDRKGRPQSAPFPSMIVTFI